MTSMSCSVWSASSCLPKFRGETIVLNAPQIANSIGRVDKVISIDHAHQRVQYTEADGSYDNESVHHACFNVSDPGVAAIEDVTYAPSLADVPFAGCVDLAIAARCGTCTSRPGPTPPLPPG